MEFKKLAKKCISLAVAAAMAVTAVVVPVATKADAAGSYSAYLCFASKNYGGVRSNHNDDGTKGVKEGNDNKFYSGIKCSNASFKKGKVNFTVSVTGKDLKKFKKEGGWNSIYVDTTLPGKDKGKLKVSKLVLKMDGKTVKTISKPTLTPDPGSTDGFTQVMCVNTWNTYSEKKCKADSIKKMPTKSMSITITGTLK